MKRSGASRATVKSPISLPLSASIGASASRPCPRQPARQQPVEPGLRARAGDLVLAVVGDLEQADARAHRAALAPDRLMGVGAAEGRHLLPGSPPSGANQSACSSPKLAPNTAPSRLAGGRRPAWCAAAGRQAAPRWGT